MSSLNRFRQLLTSVFHRAPATPIRKRHRGLIPRFERLEDRLTPTATLYVDFGAAFPGGTLNGTTGNYQTQARAPGLYTATSAFNATDSLSIQSFDSFIGAEAAAARATMMARIRQEYKPFNITVVELTAAPQIVNGHSVKAAASFADIGTTLAANNGDAKHFDSYTLVGRFTIAGSTNLGYGGLAGGVTGNAMIGDFSGMVQLSGPLQQFGNSTEYIADTIAHEAGHNFSLNHVYQSGNAGQFGQADIYYPGTVQNALDFGIDEIMSYNHVRSNMTPVGFFFRYPTLDGANQNGNTYDSLSSTKASTALQLLNDPNIGPGAYEYISGTSQHDVITITKTSPTKAHVEVAAFRDSKHTLAIPVPGTNNTRTDYAYDITLTKPLLIMTGLGDDTVRIVGGDLGTPIERDLGGQPGDTIEGLVTNTDKTGAIITAADFLGTATTFDHVRLTFSEGVQTSTVNATNVTMTGPGGGITITGVSAVAGSGGTQFDVAFASQSAIGTYTLNSGVNILDLAGNKMNQNGNAINGEPGLAPVGDQFSTIGTISGAVDKTGANVAAAFSGVAAGSFDTVTLTFSESVQGSTVNTTNVTLTGPGGAIPIASITEITSSGGTQFAVTFLPQFAAGTYTLDSGVNILDLAGNKMDQNQNGINGEVGIAPAGDQFRTTDTLIGATDTAGARITSASFSGAAVDTFDRVRFTFSEPLNPTFGFLTSDVMSITGPTGNLISVGAVTVVAGTTDTYDVTFPVQSTPGDYTIRTGNTIVDLASNKMDQNQNGINGEAGIAPTGDEFQTTATLIGSSTDNTGAKVTSAVFSGVTGNTFDTVRFTFSEALDPDFGFLTSDVVSITGPTGNSISVNAVTLVAGTKDTFDVTFASQSTPGDYTIRTGNTIVDAAFNQMDQNQNGINGEVGIAPAGDEFQTTGTLGGTTVDKTGARITATAFLGSVANTIDTVRFTFSEPLDPNNGFLASDVVSITGPTGNAIAVKAVTLVAGTNDKYDVTFAVQTTLGNYTIHTGNTIVDVAGNKMDQNQNSINGEPGIDPLGDEFEVTANLNGTTPIPPIFAVGAVDGTVRIVNRNTGTVITTFGPLDDGDDQYLGLVEVALGDFNGDGVPDVVTSAANPVGATGLATSKAAKVFVYDGATLATGKVPPTPFRTFTPFATHDGPDGNLDVYTNGLNIAVGDVNGDGFVDIIAGTRGGNGTPNGGRNEFGRLVVIDGTSPVGSDTVIGGIQTPFGPGYQKGVIVAAGNADGAGGVEIAVTRGGPVASLNPTVQQIKVKVLQLQSGTLTELKLAADGSTAFAPFGALSGPANAIRRDGRVAFVDDDGDGKAELVFSALDPLTDPSNRQVRVGVYSINVGVTSGAASIVSTGPDAGTYVTGKAVVDHATTHVAATGTQQSLALITESSDSGVVYLAPLTGVVRTGGFALNVLNGGITIDGI